MYETELAPQCRIAGQGDVQVQDKDGTHRAIDMTTFILENLDTINLLSIMFWEIPNIMQNHTAVASRHRLVWSCAGHPISLASVGRVLGIEHQVNLRTVGTFSDCGPCE